VRGAGGTWRASTSQDLESGHGPVTRAIAMRGPSTLPPPPGPRVTGVVPGRAAMARLTGSHRTWKRFSERHQLEYTH
jgi:hypothetical protein